MTSDAITLWGWEISKELFDVFVPQLSLVVGILLGGVTTFLTTSALERHKWKRDLSYRYQEGRRRAILAAFGWVRPLQQALTKAASGSSAHQSGRIDKDTFLERYPDVISTLVKLDPPAHLKALLPKAAYPISFEIIRGLEELRFLSSVSPSSLATWSSLVARLTKKMIELENYLAEEYRGTFGAPSETSKSLWTRIAGEM